MNELFYDAHFHLVPSFSKDKSFLHDGIVRCTASHSKEEYLEQKKLIEENNLEMVQCFGLHPEKPFIENLSFLEELLVKKEISCVGEAGFDLFTDEYRSNIEAQEEAWNGQLELCIKYGFPILIHVRKALEKIFKDSGKLKKLPAVIFHSFPGSVIEAEGFLKRGINAYFSFGKPLLNGAKRAIRCSKELPSERLLFETDAPYQTLKGEDFTRPEEIVKVYEKVMEIREVREKDVFLERIERNFKDCFLRP